MCINLRPNFYFPTTVFNSRSLSLSLKKYKFATKTRARVNSCAHVGIYTPARVIIQMRLTREGVWASYSRSLRYVQNQLEKTAPITNKQHVCTRVLILPTNSRTYHWLSEVLLVSDFEEPTIPANNSQIAESSYYVLAVVLTGAPKLTKVLVIFENLFNSEIFGNIEISEFIEWISDSHLKKAQSFFSAVCLLYTIYLFVH